MSESTFGPESRWGNFMDDVRVSATVKTPLEVRGTLTRLAGLVLEAVGLKVPVGSQCLIDNGHKDPVLAEVVGFSNDRAFLMPAGDTHGLSSGASVTPLAPYRSVPRVGQANKPPSPDDRGTLRLPLGRGLLGRVVDSHGNPLDKMGPIENVDFEPMGPRAAQRDGARPGAHPAGHRRARDQRLAHRRPWPAHRPLRGLWRRQERAARHDGALHQGRRDRGRADRRAWPRGEGIHRRHPRRRRPQTLGGGGRAGRCAAAGAHAGRRLCHRDCGALSRRWSGRAAADGFAHPLRHGTARNRAGHWRTTGHQGLPAIVFRQAATAGGAQRQRPERRGLDHRVLHRALRRRRPARPDRRRGTRHSRRPHRALARARRIRPFSRPSMSRPRPRA